MKQRWFILLAFLATSCSSGTDKAVSKDEAIRKKAGDDYQSITSFFRSLEDIQSIQLIAQGADKSNPQEKLDAMAKLAKKILDEGKMIDESKLDRLYPSWGTKYKGTFLKAVSVLDRGLDRKAKEDFAISDGLLAEWDTWWRDNHSQVLLALHNKYGFEIK